MNEIVITVKTLDGIHRAVDKIAEKINAPKSLLPTYGYSSSYFAHVHIEVDSHGLHWVVIERGVETQRKTTDDPHELLYWIFKNVTSSMASQFGLDNRIEGQDSRRLLFQKQEELLGELDSSWKKRAEEDHARILAQHPYDDNVLLRVKLIEDLKAKGHSSEEARKLATEKYPLPKS